MIIHVEQQDIDAMREPSQNDANPIARAIKRATAGDAKLGAVAWTVGQMPVFDEESHRSGRQMPQLYVVTGGDPMTTDFYILPPIAQAFLHQWYAADRVPPLDFELPLQPSQADEPCRVFGLPAPMLDTLKANLDRLVPQADKEIDLDSLKRGLAKLVEEGNREVDLAPVKQGVARLLEEGNREIDLAPARARLNEVGQMPVAQIGRGLAKILVTPISARSEP